jgi:TPR repeat protein
MFNLGGMYSLGQGTLKDDKEAFKWFKKAAELGNNDAMGMLGVMYYYGMGTLKDPQQAKYWIKKAYEAGNNENAEKTWNTLELWKY